MTWPSVAMTLLMIFSPKSLGWEMTTMSPYSGFCFIWESMTQSPPCSVGSMEMPTTLEKRKKKIKKTVMMMAAVRRMLTMSYHTPRPLPDGFFSSGAWLFSSSMISSDIGGTPPDRLCARIICNILQHFL